MSLFGTTSTILTLSSGTLRNVATSYSGQYIAVIATGTSNSGVFVSNNYGATFTETVVNDLPTGTKDWSTITVSPSGQYMAVIQWYPAYANTRLYRSIDYGATFNYVTAIFSANPMTISDSGTILIPAFQGNNTVITLTSSTSFGINCRAAATRILADGTFITYIFSVEISSTVYAITVYNPTLSLSTLVYKNAPSIGITGYMLESFDISADGVVAIGGWLINGYSDHVFYISRDSMNTWEFVMRGYGGSTNSYANSITLDNNPAGNLGYLRMPTVSSDGKCISINTSIKGLIYSNDQGITWNTIPGIQLSADSNNLIHGIMTQSPQSSTSSNALFYFYGMSLYKVSIKPQVAPDTSTVVKTLVSSNGLYTIKSNSPIINPDVFIKFDNSTLTTNKLIAGNSTLSSTVVSKLDVVDKWMAVSKSNTAASSSLYSGIFSFYESKASGLMFNRSNTRWRFFRDSGFDINFRPNNFTTYASIEVEATYTLSDRRLKKNIKQLGNYLEIVDDIECVSYKWLRDNGEHPDEIGVIAQQIQQVIPSITRSTDDDMLTVDYNKLSVIAIKCIQELKMEVAKLTNRVNNLQIELNLIKTEKQPNVQPNVQPAMQYEVQELN